MANIFVRPNQTATNPVTLASLDRLFVQANGRLDTDDGGTSAVTVTGEDARAGIDNSGIIDGAGSVGVFGEQSADITGWNRAGGVISGGSFATVSLGGTVNNAGLISADVRAKAVNMTGTLNNSATGTIEANSASGSAVTVSGTANNSGTILNTGARDGLEMFGDGSTLNNLAGGRIEGGRHGVTGNFATTVTNEAGAELVGRNGSGVNFDTKANDGDTLVVNYGLISGNYVGTGNGDGDGVDIDYTATILNYGRIEGNGADQVGNFADGIAAGGGSVFNFAGGEIYGESRAILFDDSNLGGAFAAATVENDGTISSALGSAIRMIGTWNDEVTNRGTISGSGVALDMGGGDDTFTNDGAVTGGVDLGLGDDTAVAVAGSTVGGAVAGGEGQDTVRLAAADPSAVGAFGASDGFETLAVEEGAWSVAGSDAFDAITIEDGATVTSAIRRDGADTLVIEQGGTLTGTLEVRNTVTSVALDNAGTIDKTAYGQAINLYLGEDDSTVTVANRETGVIRASSPDGTGSAGLIYVSGGGDAKLVFDNDGLLEGPGRVFQANDFRGESFVLNNGSGGVIRGTEGTEATLRGNITTVNNAGMIEGGNDGFDARGFAVTFNNLAGGHIEAARHAVTGEAGITVSNAAGATMIGLNGSAVNMDNNGTLEEKAFITNRGTMEGRSAELDDSDGDAIDVDGLMQLLNDGRVAGLGAEGYHNGEPNVSEGIAIGGGEIVNSAGGEIYGYGRAIQVDDSSNGAALGVSTIVNDGLIQGDGNGPEGVAPEDAARFDLRGNEAINLVGDYEDFVGNNSTGRIVGGIAMGGARDTLNNSGSIVATGGSAIDMGAGNDQVNLYVGATVEGTILLGTGDDVALATSSGHFVVEGGDGSDTMAMGASDDVLSGDGGNDFIYAGAGDDRIEGGAGNDTLFGDLGDDLIQAGAGNDVIDGGADDDVIFGDDGADIVTGGLGDDLVRGNAGDDVFVVATTADGRDSYDGGAGLDTLDFSAFTSAVSLTLRDGVTTFATDKIENVENVVGGQAADMLTGNAGDNALTGNAGDDLIRGGAGNDRLSGGLDNDDLQGGAGNDVLAGGAGDDVLTGGAGQDTFVFANLGDGIDTIADFRLSGSSADQIGLSSSLFTNFAGDDVFDLIGSGFLRAVAGENGTSIQIDHDGGGNGFETIAVLDGSLTNGMLADHSFLI